MCECNAELKESYAFMDCIERKILYCPNCKEIQDYIPQYNNDSGTFRLRG